MTQHEVAPPPKPPRPASMGATATKTASKTASAVKTAATTAINNHVHGKNTDNSAELAWHCPEKLVLPGGDRLLDFAVCGCPESDMHPQNQPIVQVVSPTNDERDRTADIQAAIDEVARRLDACGDNDNAVQQCGVVQLQPGTYVIATPPLRLHHSGIVVRGVPSAEPLPSGQQQKQQQAGVRLLCTATQTDVCAQPLFQVHGRKVSVPGSRAPPQVPITDSRNPVGTVGLHVQDASQFSVGDRVRVVRVGNAEWLHAIGMDNIPKRPPPKNPGAKPAAPQHNWEPPFNLEWERTVVAVDGATQRIQLDIGLSTAIERRWGGGWVQRITDQELAGRIHRCGVEHLSMECRVNTRHRQLNRRVNTDVCVCEQHVERAISFDNCERCWAVGVHAVNFGHHTWIRRGASRVTVANCNFLEPAWRVDGGTRYGFFISGQLSLVRDCFTDLARHAFVCDQRVCGPNVFYRCQSRRDMASSETHHRWGSGILYDNCVGEFAVQNRAYMGSGHGISGANCVVWNCQGPVIVQHPPTAWNFAVGKRGKMSVAKAAFPPPHTGFPPTEATMGDCFVWHWDGHDRQQPPVSLYEHLLARHSSM